MRTLLNTLYIMTPENYLRLDGENVVISRESVEIGRVPLHNLQGIVTFGYSGASPALMGACANRGISLCFMTKNGRFLASVVGEMKGNVVLRKEQYRISDDLQRCTPMARNMIIGKIYNCKWILERATRDHPLQVDVENLKNTSKFLSESLRSLRNEELEIDNIMGMEGNAASRYFKTLDNLILHNKEDFYIHDRNRRPPTDRVNAMLSFLYTMLANDCAAALSTVGLDPYVGFLHRDRPGRVSLALDLMEELRPVFVDRFVIALINKHMIEPSDFIEKENKAILMTDDGRKKILSAWQNKKQEKIQHPYLCETVEWGLIPYVQSLLLARTIRGDLDGYPTFIWK